MTYSQFTGKREIRVATCLPEFDKYSLQRLWHIEKDKNILRDRLRMIDRDLGFVRNYGRQALTDKNPPGFSRIVHDYSDARKGFVVWKDQFEERLT